MTTVQVRINELEGVRHRPKCQLALLFATLPTLAVTQNGWRGRGRVDIRVPAGSMGIGMVALVGCM